MCFVCFNLSYHDYVHLVVFRCAKTNTSTPIYLSDLLIMSGGIQTDNKSILIHSFSFISLYHFYSRIYKMYKMCSISHKQANSESTNQTGSLTQKYLFCLYDKHWGQRKGASRVSAGDLLCWLVTSSDSRQCVETIWEYLMPSPVQSPLA